jgi:hypothetical protein
MALRFVLLFTYVLGCGGQTQTESTPAPEKKQQPPPSLRQSAAPSVAKHACGKNQEFEGRVKMEGVLQRTKGGQLLLKGTLISLPIPPGQKQMKLRAAYKKWYGRHVVLQGDRCVYHCPPHAQCLKGGVIPSLRNVKILKGDPSSPTP